MYNGIGLSTARGSGTNGHVQRNLSLLPSMKHAGNKMRIDDVRTYESPTSRKKDQSLIDHDNKRKIEVKLLEFADSLEEKG